MRFSSQNSREDVVQSSLSELILFLLFFFLILLASFVSSQSAGGNEPTLEKNEYREIIDGLEQKAQGLVAENEKLNGDLKDALALLDVQGLDQASASRKLSDALAENGKLRESLLSLRRSLADSQQAADQFASRFEDSQAANRTLEERLEEKASNIADLEKKLSRLEALNIALRAKEEDLEAQVLALQALIGDKDSLIGAQQRRLDDTEDRLVVAETAQDRADKLAHELAEKYAAAETNLTEQLKQVLTVTQDNQRLSEAVNTLKRQLAEAEEALKTTDWPASLNLSDNSGYRFESGSYVPSSRFLSLFDNEGMREIFSRLAQHGDEIKYIEIIGHTDEEFHDVGANSDLDRKLISFLSRTRSNNTRRWPKIQQADNAGLGLARAAAISILVREAIRSEYPNIVVLPYSAGQMIKLGNVVALGPVRDVSDRRRRRIEIRFRGEK